MRALLDSPVSLARFIRTGVVRFFLIGLKYTKGPLTLSEVEVDGNGILAARRAGQRPKERWAPTQGLASKFLTRYIFDTGRLLTQSEDGFRTCLCSPTPCWRSRVFFYFEPCGDASTPHVWSQSLWTRALLCLFRVCLDSNVNALVLPSDDCLLFCIM